VNTVPAGVVKNEGGAIGVAFFLWTRAFANCCFDDEHTEC
jgi:hypothetical protein